MSNFLNENFFDLKERIEKEGLYGKFINKEDIDLHAAFLVEIRKLLYFMYIKNKYMDGLLRKNYTFTVPFCSNYYGLYLHLLDNKYLKEKTIDIRLFINIDFNFDNPKYFRLNNFLLDASFEYPNEGIYSLYSSKEKEKETNEYLDFINSLQKSPFFNLHAYFILRYYGGINSLYQLSESGDNYIIKNSDILALLIYLVRYTIRDYIHIYLGEDILENNKIFKDINSEKVLYELIKENK